MSIVRAISSILRLNINYRKQRPARHTAKSHHLSFASWGKLRSMAALCILHCIASAALCILQSIASEGHCVYCIKRRQCVYCIRGTCRGPGSLLPSSGGEPPLHIVGYTVFPPYCWIHIAHFPVTSILNNGKIPFKEKHFQDSQWFLAQDKTVQSQG